MAESRGPVRPANTSGHAAGKSLRTIQAALVASGHKVSHVTVNRILKGETAGA
jgi:hypothetical protein